MTEVIEGHAPMPPEGGDIRIVYRASEVLALGNRRYDEGFAAGLAQGKEALSLFGDYYDINGEQQWHSYNCTYRKTWVMFSDEPNDDDDEEQCVKARAVLGSGDNA